MGVEGHEEPSHGHSVSYVCVCVLFLVCNADIELFENQTQIAALAKDVYRIATDNKEIDANLDAISAYQHELQTSLEQLENDIDKMYEEPGKEPEQADIKREEMYHMAVDVDEQLNGMTKTLKETIQQLNASQEAKTKTDNPVSGVVK